MLLFASGELHTRYVAMFCSSRGDPDQYLLLL